MKDESRQSRDDSLGRLLLPFKVIIYLFVLSGAIIYYIYKVIALVAMEVVSLLTGKPTAPVSTGKPSSTASSINIPTLPPESPPSPIVSISTPVPSMSRKARQIYDFLNDAQTTSLLWEEWRIFNELIRVESLITITEFPDVVKYYDQRRTLLPRASTNFSGLAQVVTPDVISSFWNSIIKALHYFNKGYGNVDDPKDMAMREKCISINHEAWSELKDICTKHGLKLEWPLPRTQAS